MRSSTLIGSKPVLTLSVSKISVIWEEHEPVAGHAPVAVGEVRLNVIIQAMVYLLGLLLPKLLD